MNNSKLVSRRDFNLQSALAILSGTTIIVSGCESASPTEPTSATTAGSDVLGVISANHGHDAVITAAQLISGGALLLDIQGSSNHPHTVQLSSNEIMQIDNGTQVVKVSSNDDAHTHNVTFN